MLDAPPAPTPQSGVVMGGTAILSAMNNFTPHVAGAVDILVVEQPDGTLKCSPFYGASSACACIPMLACMMATICACHFAC